LRAAAANLPNVTVQASVAFDELVELYRESDVLVACLRQRSEFLTAVPSKLYEYAATGRTLLLIGGGEAAEITRSLGGEASTSITIELVENLVQRARASRVGVPEYSDAIHTREESADLLVRAARTL
jgi:hypothetical protein